MSNNIFLSTTCFNNNSLEEIIKISKENGITNLEISGGLKFIDEKKITDLLEKNIDINFRFHNYFPIPKNPFVINLASKETCEKSISNILKGISYASKYGKKMFSFHAGLRFDPVVSSLGNTQLKYEIIKSNESYKLLEQSINKIYIEKVKDTIICIENNVVEEKNFHRENNKYIFSDLSDTDFMKKLMKNYNIKILLDVAHLKVSSKTLKFDPYKFIDEYKNSIHIAHLSDNNSINDEGKILKRDSWFWKSLDWKKIKYISLEIKNEDIDILKQQIELTSKMVSL
jgi:sugar phosphate isomerase/epimerase